MSGDTEKAIADWLHANLNAVEIHQDSKDWGKKWYINRGGENPTFLIGATDEAMRNPSYCLGQLESLLRGGFVDPPKPPKFWLIRTNGVTVEEDA